MLITKDSKSFAEIVRESHSSAVAVESALPRAFAPWSIHASAVSPLVFGGGETEAEAWRDAWAHLEAAGKLLERLRAPAVPPGHAILWWADEPSPVASWPPVIRTAVGNLEARVECLAPDRYRFVVSRLEPHVRPHTTGGLGPIGYVTRVVVAEGERDVREHASRVAEAAITSTTGETPRIPQPPGVAPL